MLPEALPSVTHKGPRCRRLDISPPSFDLADYGAAQKQLALIFELDVLFNEFDSHVLVYSNTGLLQDQKLVYGGNQFLFEIESVDLPLFLYFIQAGGYWFFRGLSGYFV